MMRDHLRILVVDDEPLGRDLLVEMLRPSGHQTVVCSGGAEAMALFEAGSAPAFDVLIIDIMMPEISGLDVIRHLRARPELRDFPILAVSARIGNEDQLQALEAGANDYLRRPFLRPELFRSVERLVYRQRIQQLQQARLSGLKAELRAILAEAKTNDGLFGACAEAFVSHQLASGVEITWGDAFGAAGAPLPSEKSLECLPLADDEGPGGTIRLLPTAPFTDESRSTLSAIADWLAESFSRREAQEALRTSERLFEKIWDTAFDGMCLVEFDGRFRMVNRRLADMYGYTQDDMVGLSAFDLTDDEGRRVMNEQLRHRREGQSSQYECPALRRDGTHFWVAISGAPFSTADGQTMSIAVIRDISDHKRLEQHLQDRNAAVEAEVREATLELQATNQSLKVQAEAIARQQVLLEGLLNHLPACVSVVGLDLRFQLVNPAFAKVFDQAPAQFVGQAVFDLMPDAREQLEGPLEQVLGAGEAFVAYGYPLTIERHRGYWDLHLVPLADAEGQVTGLLSLGMEVTPRVLLEQELARQRDDLERLVSSAPIGIAVLDAELRYVLSNPENNASLGQGEVRGRQVFEVLPTMRPWLEPALTRALAGTPVKILGQRIEMAEEGRTYYADLGFYPIEREGCIDGVLFIGSDVTARVENEHMQNERVEALEEAAAMKDDFVSTVSHELRTPLTVVRNAVSILLKGRAGVLTTEQHEFCAIIADHTERLTRLVDDLLEMQTLAAKPLAIALDQADLRALVPEVATSFQSVLEANGLEMVITLPPDPVPVHFDRQRLSQVLLNLLSNAGKFTPAGGTVTLRLERHAEEAWLSVSDTGIGLKSEELPRIFDKFVQLEAGKQSHVGGTGLGLAICKQLVEEGHGGRIWAEALPEGGARFTVALPLAPGAVRP